MGVVIADPLSFANAFLGIIAAGRIAAPLDPNASEQDLVAVINRIEADVVLGDRKRLEGIGTPWIEIDEEELRTLALSCGDVDGPLPAHSGGVLLSTSGTTGRPKRIILTEDQLLYAAAAIVEGHGIGVSDKGFSPLPLFHINAEVVGLLGTLVAGATLVLDDRFHRSGFWQTVADHKVTWINTVPAILARLTPLRDGEVVADTLRFARSASAPLPPAILHRFEEATGVPVVETYGMTEGCSQITANPVGGVRKVGSVGKAVGVEVRIHENGAPHVDYPGQLVGPVEIRGQSIITRYASEGYESRFIDGWLQTGDLGYLDDEGYLFLVGRVDDVINRGGEKIFPREVEDAIIVLDDVASVVVVPQKDEVFGQVPVAHIVVADNVGREKESLLKILQKVEEHCVDALSKPKRPIAYRAVSALPAGATGKVRRHEVHEVEPLAVWETK